MRRATGLLFLGFGFTGLLSIGMAKSSGLITTLDDQLFILWIISGLMLGVGLFSVFFSIGYLIMRGDPQLEKMGRTLFGKLIWTELIK